MDINIFIPCSIGNHDCEGSIEAMLSYAKRTNSRWMFPKRYYHMDQRVDNSTIVRFLVLDACDLVCGAEPRNFRCVPTMNAQTSSITRTEQYKWIERTLKLSKPKTVDRMWTVVVGHWAVYSYAGNSQTQELIDNLEPLLQKYKVHAYFNGHDHSLQHIRKYHPQEEWSPHYFTSGAGGYALHTLQPQARSHPDLIHAATVHGFMWVNVTHSIFRVQFLDDSQQILYTTDVQYA